MRRLNAAGCFTRSISTVFSKPTSQSERSLIAQTSFTNRLTKLCLHRASGNQNRSTTPTTKAPGFTLKLTTQNTLQMTPFTNLITLAFWDWIFGRYGLDWSSFVDFKTLFGYLWWLVHQDYTIFPEFHGIPNLNF